MSKRSGSDNGCATVIVVFFFFGLFVQLFGVTLWILQYALPVAGLVLAILIAYQAWVGVRRSAEAHELAERNHAELQQIAMDTEYQLTAILSAWDNVNTTMGVGTIYKDVFASGEATPELIELRGELSRARKLNNRLREQRETMTNRELVEAISDADALWCSLTKTYQNARREL
ncbi:hypothetical protein [Corynebacterium amycolatum]|uniref:hypothetical protein n=1 Tax=Corynebacterium amycolatum TaxID=43765 RepID=UPI001244E506|nr:hypothetical protein [Corynebacterium amycolatum]KAA9224222.1 hypothetical protein F6I44_04260 [Corynebacterium amycolatum]MDK6443212.1 hypothetical protein [Corynebacterium amycolatum]